MPVYNELLETELLKSNSLSTSQKISYCLCILQAHCCVHKVLLLDTLISRLNPLHNVAHYFSENNFLIISLCIKIGCKKSQCKTWILELNVGHTITHFCK